MKILLVKPIVQLGEAELSEDIPSQVENFK